MLTFATEYIRVMLMNKRVIISDNIGRDLAEAISESEHDRIFVLTDTNTSKACWPRLESQFSLKGAQLLEIKAGDENKNLEQLALVWQQLQQGGATRHSLLICLGGGMVTDLGGFAGSTYKRGINRINLPTTLLAMVDASVGGKTGINFGGLKNEVGTFSDPRFVILDTNFLDTLDETNLRAGYAEMLKHGLIDTTDHWASLLRYDLANPDLEALKPMLARSVAVKERIVKEDPKEKGIRKALNLGHTLGHALEEFSLQREASGKGAALPHGYAVAYGMVGELYLSVKLCDFPTDKLHQTAQYIAEYYGRYTDFTCDDYPTLLNLMRHDKKNQAGQINCSLLSDVGKLRLNSLPSDEDIKEALDFIREY